MMKFLKSFGHEYKFVASVVEEEPYTPVNTTEPNPIVINSFDITSILEKKINEEPILDFISKLKQKEFDSCQVGNERRQKE
jgi:hypothetical protein